MPGPNETMLTRQQQRLMKDLRRVETAKLKSFSEEELWGLEKSYLKSMDSGVKQMERLGIKEMGVGSDFAVSTESARETEIPQMQEDLERRESSRKKMKDQEKDAWKRAEKKGLPCPEAQSGEIQEARRQFADNASRTPLPEDYSQIKPKLSGTEFTPDPETGKVDLADIMEKRRKLAAMIQNFRKQVKEPTMEQESNAAANEEILKYLDDAITTYSLASGVDIASGKTVSSSKAEKARQHLALALEKYREGMQNIHDLVGQQYLDRFQKKFPGAYEEKRRQYLDAYRIGTKAATGLDLVLTPLDKDTITDIREWISENPEAYAENKEKVDQLYHEFLSLAKQTAEESLHDMALNELIRGTAISGPRQFAFDLIQKRRQSANHYRTILDSQKMAIKYLLKGSQPESAVQADLFKTQWGVETEMSRELEANEQMLSRMEQANAELEAEQKAIEERKTLEAELAEEERIRTEFEQKWDEVRDGLRENPDNEELQKANSSLERNKDSTLAMLKGLNSISEQNRARLAATDQFLNLKLQNEDGKEVPMPGKPVYRDSAYLTTAVGHAHEANIDKMKEMAGAFCIVDSGKSLNRSIPTENEKIKAYLDLSGWVEEGLQDIRAFMDTKPELFRAKNIPYLTILKSYGDISALHSKVQSTTTILRRLRANSLTATLPEEQQKELKDMYLFSDTLMEFLRDLEGRATRQNLIREGGDPEEILADYTKNLEEAVVKYSRGVE